MFGADTPSQRDALLKRIAAGEVDLLVGTQALAHAAESGKMDMQRLGLVIIDALRVCMRKMSWSISLRR